MSSTENNYVNTDLGNVALNSCGEYNADSSYEYLDTVNYEGGSYFCKVEFPKKISGIAPKAGVSTEFWQLLTIPGDATSEYIKLHDEVVNKAKQVETSRAAVELSQTEVEAAQADVSQMRQDTQEAAEEAASSRDSAAGYAQSAETSRTAAKESEDNINAQVAEFDTHVAEKTSAAETAITEARRAAVNAVSTKQDDATQAVTDEGDKQIKKVEDAGTEQVGKAKSAGASAVSAAGAAGVSAVNAVKAQQTASIKAIQEAGKNALQNISNGVDKGLSEEGKAADAKATGEAISKLTEDLGNVADVTGKRINGIFVGNNYVSPLALEAGTTYHIFYKSGSKAQFYVEGDTNNFVVVDEGGLYEFTPNTSATAKLFRNTVDSKNDIMFYIGTDLTFFRDIRKIEETYVATQAEIEEHSKKIDTVETSVNELFVEEKITETNDRSTITQTLATNYCIGISNKINSGIKIEKITFGTELAKEPYILFVDANGLVLRKWTIKSKVLNIDYTTEADGFFVFHVVGSGSGFKWKSGATDGSINTLIFQYASPHEAEIAVGENISKPNFNITAKVWVDCEITTIEMNYEAFKDNKYRGKKIAFLGDSITQGLTWNGSAQVYVDKPYPMTVAEKLECICQNVGHSSYPISSIGKAQCFNTTYVEIDRDVDYIFVFGGTNDFQYSVPVGTIADREDISFYGAVFSLINKIRTRNPNAKLVFFTPLHRSAEVKSDGFKLIDYVNAIRDVCELCAIPVVDLYKNSGFSNVVTEMEQYYADGLHLTQDGYNLLGTVISELILVH